MIAEAPPTGWDRAVLAVEGSRLASLADLPALSGLPTPALVIDAAAVDRNIETTIARLGGADRWRAHVKTAKAAWAIERLMVAGITTFKASTTAELEMTLAAGAADVMLAYSAVGPTLVEAGRLADAYPAARVSALVDDASILATWPVSTLGAYIDLDSGMHRSGMPIEDHASIRALASRIRERGIELRGLHEYDGHLGGVPDGPREAASRLAFERLLAVTAALESDGHRIAELVVGGSHTSEASLVELAAGRTTAVVRLGPGTVIYGDLTSLSRLPDRRIGACGRDPRDGGESADPVDRDLRRRSPRHPGRCRTAECGRRWAAVARGAASEPGTPAAARSRSGRPRPRARVSCSCRVTYARRSASSTRWSSSMPTVESSSSR